MEVINLKYNEQEIDVEIHPCCDFNFLDVTTEHPSVWFLANGSPGEVSMVYFDELVGCVLKLYDDCVEHNNPLVDMLRKTGEYELSQNAKILKIDERELIRIVAGRIRDGEARELVQALIDEIIKQVANSKLEQSDIEELFEIVEQEVVCTVKEILIAKKESTDSENS